MRIRLQVGVALTFTLLTLIVVGATVGFLYRTHKQLALETANTAMDEARQAATVSLLRVVEPIGRAVETTASLVAAFPDGSRSLEGMAVLNAQIRDLKQVYGLYFGLDKAGEFYQVVRLPKGLSTYGPEKLPIPPDSKRLFRAIEPDQDGARRDTFLFQSDWGTVTGEATRTAEFDPRTRPWYASTRGTDRVLVSPMYVFYSTGQPGLTLSKRILTPTGGLYGVVGADITLDGLADILDRIRVGENGHAFLLNREGWLIAQSGKDVARKDAVLVPGDSPNVQPIHNPVIAAAVHRWNEHHKERFGFKGPGGVPYLASVQPLSAAFGIRATLGFIVPESQFVGAINESTELVLQLSALVLVGAVIATILLSRALSRQIRSVAGEAHRINQFDLDDDFALKSRVVEVDELSTAMMRMKSSLRSFGKYVPKYVVEEIVRSDVAPRPGGQRRDIAVLFTDLEGFTVWSQKVGPDQLADELSRYLTGICDIIEARGGVVDKFVGDAVMAYWNAPLPEDDYLEKACLATLEARNWVNEVMLADDGSGERKFYTRFGLHAGEVFVGNVGSDERMDYTVVGAAVNLGSRLEPLNKNYATQILVSDLLMERCAGEFQFCWVDTVLPVGALEAMDVYELVAARPDWADAPAHLVASEADLERCRLWDSARELYRARQWDALIELLEERRRRAGEERMTTLYLDRARKFIAEPPPDDWNYVTVYLSKR